MKKRMSRRLWILLAGVAVLASCAGPAGAAGPKGESSAAGPPGPPSIVAPPGKLKFLPPPDPAPQPPTVPGYKGPFSFGRDATTDEIKAWDIDIMADGTGLPLGRGTVAEGATVYAAKCAKCHGATGTEGPFDALVKTFDPAAPPGPSSPGPSATTGPMPAPSMTSSGGPSPLTPRGPSRTTRSTP